MDNNSIMVEFQSLQNSVG